MGGRCRCSARCSHSRCVCKKIAVLIGQSNQLGAAVGAQALNNQIYPPLPYYDHIQIDPTEAVYNWAPLGLRLSYSGSYYVGPEIDLARRLEEVEPGQWVIFKFTISSTSIVHWLPATNYPSGYPNVWTQLTGEMASASAAIQGDVRFVAWSIGETDASQQSSANVFQSRMITFHDAWMPLFPTTEKFLVAQLHINNLAPGKPTIRTAQANLGALPGWGMVDLDGYALQGDNVHFTLASQFAMGSEFADAYFAN